MLKRLLRVPTAVLIGSLLLTSACSAQSDASAGAARYVEGTQYVTLPAPHQRYSEAGKVEVVEVFSYGCVHCAHFAPLVEEMKKELPKGVVFKLMPAPFSAEWLPFARAYYAANKLGVVDRTHLELFKEKFDQHYPIDTLGELADFYARQGVNRDEFLRIANSDAATAKMKKDFALLKTWGVTGTPTLVIDGKYRTADVSTLQQLVDMTVWLAKRELAAKSGGKGG